MQEIIIMGANGRMGSTLVRLTQADPELRLVGVCERPGHEAGLEGLGCLVASDADPVCAAFPAAAVIDFTAPEASLVMARTAARHGNPAVIGTTGFTPGQQAELAELAQGLRLFWAPNMSVGINVLLKILPRLVQALGPDYDLEMMEIHHHNKKDAPSGTALKLAQGLAEARGWNYDEVKRHCRDGIIGPRPPREIGVQSLRGGDVVGEHTVYFFGPGERIEVKHCAHSRDTFAQGALRAAKWLAGQQPGKLWTMADLF